MAQRNKENENQSKQPGAGSPGSDAMPENTSQIPAYLEAALRIPASYPLGAPSVDKDTLGTMKNWEEANTSWQSANAPGVFTLDYVPMLGVSKGVTSAVNRAAAQEFNAIRSKISGNRPYQSGDHFIYRTAVDSLRDLYYYVRRIYGIVRGYSATNLYRPRAILKGMGIDVEDWIANASLLYQWLKMHQTSLIPFPTVPIGNITNRHNVYNSYLFTDGDIDSTQTYIINQRAFWSYEVVDEVKGLTPRLFPATYAEFLVMWDEMYAALRESTDAYIIAADIRRAFEDRMVNTLPDTDVDYVVEYKKLDPVLTSIMNANVLYIDKTSWDYNLRQCRIYDGMDQGLLCTPHLRTESLGQAYADHACAINVKLSHLNFVEANPDAKAILNALRFHPLVDMVTEVRGRNGDTDGYLRQVINVEACGTELLVGGRFVHIAADGDLLTNPFCSGFAFATNGNNVVTTAFKGVVNLFGVISNFDWHPPVTAYFITNMNWSGSNEDDSRVEILGKCEDVQNYVPISDYQVQQIHEANILAEFGF